MATLSILAEDGIMITCANIYPRFPIDCRAGAKIIFEVLEVDASSLKRRVGKTETFGLNTDQLPFTGQLTSLEPCTSTVPALALMRDRPALRGVLTVYGPVNLVGQQGNAN